MPWRDKEIPGNYLPKPRLTNIPIPAGNADNQAMGFGINPEYFDEPCPEIVNTINELIELAMQGLINSGDLYDQRGPVA